jgi:hypothetical protein
MPMPSWLRKFFPPPVQYHLRILEDKIRTSEATARYLLLSCLTPAQREQWEDSRWFTAVGNISGAEYDIGRGGSMVRLKTHSVLLDSIREFRFCVQIGEPNIPIADHYLAIKLMIENDEKMFREIAVLI